MANPISSFSTRAKSFLCRKVLCIPVARTTKLSKKSRHVRQKQNPAKRSIPQHTAGSQQNSSIRMPRSISDPGIEERGVRGLRGGGCGPSKLSHHQGHRRQPQRSTSVFAEDHDVGARLTQSRLDRKYGGYDPAAVRAEKQAAGTAASQTAAPQQQHQLQPQANAGTIQQASNYGSARSRTSAMQSLHGGRDAVSDHGSAMSRTSAIQLGLGRCGTSAVNESPKTREDAYEMDSIRGIRGGCLPQHEEDISEEPNRILRPARGCFSHQEAGSIARGRQKLESQKRDAAAEEYRDPSEHAERYTKLDGVSCQQQRLRGKRGGRDGTEGRTRKANLMDRVRHMVCCSDQSQDRGQDPSQPNYEDRMTANLRRTSGIEQQRGSLSRLLLMPRSSRIVRVS